MSVAAPPVTDPWSFASTSPEVLTLCISRRAASREAMNGVPGKSTNPRSVHRFSRIPSGHRLMVALQSFPRNRITFRRVAALTKTSSSPPSELAAPPLLAASFVKARIFLASGCKSDKIAWGTAPPKLLFLTSISSKQ
jgi:hypothetical protein